MGGVDDAAHEIRRKRFFGPDPRQVFPDGFYRNGNRILRVRLRPEKAVSNPPHRLPPGSYGVDEELLGVFAHFVTFLSCYPDTLLRRGEPVPVLRPTEKNNQQKHDL